MPNKVVVLYKTLVEARKNEQFYNTKFRKSFIFLIWSSETSVKDQISSNKQDDWRFLTGPEPK